jgi:tetratricopeptide (TPR) repeat protein
MGKLAEADPRHPSQGCPSLESEQRSGVSSGFETSRGVGCGGGAEAAWLNGLHYNLFSIAALSAHRLAAHRPPPPCFPNASMPTHHPTPSSRSWLTCLLLSMSVCLAWPARADELADVQRLYYSGQAAAAMERADQFLANKPKDPQMRFVKGVMLADAKRNAEALVLFQQLTEDYPDLAEPYNNLAALYAAAGDYTKARATLEQALRTNPAYAVAHENLGDLYAAMAAQSYSRALKLDPSNVTVPPKLAIVRELYKNRAAETTGSTATPAATASK